MKRWVQVRTQWQWDRYCLWLSVGGGSLAGILWILPALSMALGSSLLAHARRQGFGDFLLMVIVSNVARVPRRRLLWVLVPPVFWLAWSVTDSVALGNWPGLVRALQGKVLNVGLDLVFGCIIAFFLGRFGRGREGEDAITDRPALTNSHSQEGVWPPAPNY